MVHPAAGQTGTNAWGNWVDASLPGKLDAATAAAIYASATVMVGAGIDPTGATDSTSAMQAKINSAPPGTPVVIPEGIYTFSTLTVTDGKYLSGGGWWSEGNWGTGGGIYGDSLWATSDSRGTVLRSTATSGIALRYEDGVHQCPYGGGLGGFVLIGPGSGTAVGIQIGSSTTAVQGLSIRNVKVCNFPTGVKMQNLYSGTFDLLVRGCTTGVVLADNTNSSDWRMLDIQRCTTALTLTGDCMGNAFYAPIVQSNEVGFVVNGRGNTWYSPYCENNTVLAFDFVAGTSNMLINPYLFPGGSGVRIQAEAISTTILGQHSTVVPIEDNGVGTFILGDTRNVTGARTFGARLDTRAGTSLLPDISVDADGAGRIQLTSDATAFGQLSAESGALVWYGPVSHTRTVIAPA
jgi:hypothetical protein